MRASRIVAAWLVVGLCFCPSVSRAVSIHVNTTDDAIGDDGFCALREAVIAANSDTPSGVSAGECAAGAGADTILLPAGLYQLDLSGDGEDDSATGDLDVLNDDLSIVGAGARTTFIDGAVGDRIFDIDDPSLTVTISGVTIQNGDVIDDGGGIQNSGTLIIDACTIRNNTAGLEGGGIENLGNLTITNSTISGNLADGDGGGINLASGTATLRNCTISGNIADGNGGGLNQEDGITVLSNVTIAGNTADSGDGGGVSQNGGTLTVRNSIIGANTDSDGDAPDCYGTLTSQGYNHIQRTNECTITGTLTGNATGSNPQLGGLANNGGHSDTRALLGTSPALDSGNPAPPGSGGTACEATDQRAVTRPQDGNGDSSARCDKGAFELALTATPTPTVTATITDTLVGTAAPTPTMTPTRTMTSTPALDNNLCFVVGEASDTLMSVNRRSRAVNTIASISGASDIQAVAMAIAGRTLYAAAADQLGTISLSTGVFTPTSSVFGEGDGPNGLTTFDNITGLALSPRSGWLYGVHQEDADEDVLFRIDPHSGAFVPLAFDGGFDDYAPISGCLDDIEDIAINRRDQIYAISNDDEEDDELVMIDPDTGDCTSIGPIVDALGSPINDMGGLSFHSDGQLYGTTAGNAGSNADRFWRINRNSAVATLYASLPPGGDDEALACQPGGCMPSLKLRHVGLVDRDATFIYRFMWLNRCDTFPATGVVVTNTLPSDIELVSVSAAVPFEINGNSVTFNVGTLVKHPAGLATITARIKPSAGVGRTIQNKAVLRDSYGREVTAISKFKVK